MSTHQAPPSLGFSRQEHWSGLPFPSPMRESEKWKWSHSVVPTLSDPTDCSLPGSSVHGIFQARVLEWVPLPSPTLNLHGAKCPSYPSITERSVFWEVSDPGGHRPRQPAKVSGPAASFPSQPHFLGICPRGRWRLSWDPMCGPQSQRKRFLASGAERVAGGMRLLPGRWGARIRH